jgi:UDP:flavonoid glycosyltransferase YjiC (YdhE family)
MRVLVTTLPATGHFNSTMPLAQALKAAGHEVAVCCADAFALAVRAHGMDHLPGGATDFRQLFAGGPPPGDRDRARWAQRIAFATRGVEAMLPDLLEHARAWQPDVIVRESAEHAGPLVAEMLRLPHVSIGTGAWSGRDERRAMVADVMDGWCRQLGLPPDPDGHIIFRYLHLAFTPPRWDGDHVHPQTVHFIRYENPERPGEERPAWLDEPRHGPMVFASLGTVMHSEPGLFEAIIEGLANEPMTVIAAVGRDADLARFGTPPPNVRIERYVPQIAVLGEADLFVTHGGFNGTKEALSLGLPLVVLPIGGDQPYTAERVEALGLGRSIGPDERDAATIRDRVRQVLADPRFRANARQFAADMRALPPMSHAVALVERLVRERRPLLRD